ncbi:MAG: Rab family GTPase [Phycisphaerales bacterium]
MISKKVCMVGAFAVGKSSLVQRFVLSTFSDKYITTIGANVKKKSVTVAGEDVTLMIWDLAGEDEFQWLQTTHLRGSAGMMLVIDGTRRSTLDVAIQIEERVRKEIGMMPSVAVVVVNKADLRPQWEVTADDLKSLEARGWRVFIGSAKSGEGVQEAFEALALRVIGKG